MGRYEFGQISAPALTALKGLLFSDNQKFIYVTAVLTTVFVNRHDSLSLMFSHATDNFISTIPGGVNLRNTLLVAARALMGSACTLD